MKRHTTPFWEDPTCKKDDSWRIQRSQSDEPREPRLLWRLRRRGGLGAGLAAGAAQEVSGGQVAFFW